MEIPYYSPAWTTEQAELEFYKRMTFAFDGRGFPCWHDKNIKTWFDAMLAETQNKLAWGTIKHYSEKH